MDPLAVDYASLFTPWMGGLPGAAAFGEQLPFRSETFDVVLCENVVDHAERPAAIVAELIRVLRPGGTLYFTVNVHHPIYHYASAVHGAWNALGVRFEIGPFADHTVHLTAAAARALWSGFPLMVMVERTGIDAARAQARTAPERHLGDRLKRLFFKNARYVLIARKVATPGLMRGETAAGESPLRLQPDSQVQSAGEGAVQRAG